MNSGSFSILLTKAYRLAYERGTSAFDRLFYFLHIRLFGLPDFSTSGKNVIVYINDTVLRSSRMVRWVKRFDKVHTILLCPKIAYNPKLLNNEWDTIIFYRNPYHVLRVVRQLKNVYLYHGFIPKNYLIDLVRRQVKVPFIVDSQDIYACYYGLNPSVNWIQEELPLEKNCLQQPDGLIAQSLEANYALRIYGGRKPRTLYFPLYCDNDLFQENHKALDPDDIHIVYAGGVSGANRDRKQFGITQFHELIGVLEKQKIHFHIYPNPNNLKGDFNDYYKLSASHAYFHFHPSVSQDELPAALNKYHFGILPFFKSQSGLTDIKFKYATALKLFNFIEAGIPVLVSEDLYFQSWFIRRADAGIVIREADVNTLREVIERIDYPALVKQLSRKRESISLKTHTPRLLEFYRQVAGR